MRSVFSALLAIAVTVVVLGTTSCSDVKYATPSDASVSDVGAYFPMSTGYTSVYEVTYANGAQSTFTSEIGRPADVQGHDAVEWYSFDGNSGDTAYFAETSTSLLYFSSRNAAPEKVLSLPLTPGYSWSRYETYYGDRDNDTDGDGTNDSYDYGGLKGGLEDTDDPGGPKDTVTATEPGNGDDPLYVAFPTNGSNTMIVLGIEDIALSNGARYARTIKLYNTGSGGTNYYWFAQGVGLVKYVFGGNQDGSAGNTVGELVAHGL